MSYALMLATMLAAATPEPASCASIKSNVVNVVVESNGQVRRDGKLLTKREFEKLRERANTGIIILGVLYEPSLYEGSGQVIWSAREPVRIGIANPVLFPPTKQPVRIGIVNTVPFAP